MDMVGGSYTCTEGKNRMTDRVLTDITAGVMTITMNRPRKKNAFNPEQYNSFSDALKESSDSGDVTVVLITGAGDAFTAGQDLKAMGEGFPSFLKALSEFDKPLLAAVNGVGIGVGVTMLFHCDIVWVGASARLRMPFTSLGIQAEAGSTYLSQLHIGPRRAAELIFTGDWISSEEAVEFGIASRVLPDDKLIPDMTELAARIAAQPPNTLRVQKQLLLAARKDALNAAIARESEAAKICIGSPENVEALRAFAEKRPPDFSKLR